MRNLEGLGDITMTRVCLVGALLLGLGCSSDGPKQQWGDFKKEMNNDIILKSDFTHSRPEDSPATAGKGN
jgi:hypothetical protein